MTSRGPAPPAPSAAPPRGPGNRGPGRHRAPARARVGGPRLAEGVSLGLALLVSSAAVLLRLQGQRPTAVAVAAAGLALAVTGLVLARRPGLRRGSGSPDR
ncbi:hypothetical protein [Kineococcus radiotolerans]|uniref:hypothetical protein n=1 Tax=Kineococcus radiotolerans TaxID=131568 RepID=UPI00003A40B5|nr:hypothetical protein [Kineococcus radiotolerans]